jgi:hypothetical protein
VITARPGSGTACGALVTVDGRGRQQLDVDLTRSQRYRLSIDSSELDEAGRVERLGHDARTVRPPQGRLGVGWRLRAGLEDEVEWRLGGTPYVGEAGSLQDFAQPSLTCLAAERQPYIL